MGRLQAILIPFVDCFFGYRPHRYPECHIVKVGGGDRSEYKKCECHLKGWYFRRGIQCPCSQCGRCECVDFKDSKSGRRNHRPQSLDLKKYVSFYLRLFPPKILPVIFLAARAKMAGFVILQAIPVIKGRLASARFKNGFPGLFVLKG